MKTRLLMMTFSLAGVLSLGLVRATAELEVSAGVTIHTATDFYEPLAPSGAWVNVGSYGRCWRPARVAADWRPYCHGNWEWTDAGWYWASDEPWAWACYHYGTWVYDSNYGWVWIPGIEWAPAWVYWRTGGGYIGWAPCGPAGFTIEPSFYVIVESRHFHDRIRPDTVIVNNPAIIKNTTEIKNVRREQRQFDGKSQTVVVNEGPRVDMVEKATGHKFTAVPVREADRQTFGSVPGTLKHRTAKPAFNETAPVIQAQPNLAPERKPAPGGNSEMPNTRPPGKEAPAEKVIPSERTIPQTPPERIAPPANKESPPNKRQRPPMRIAPPSQPPQHPPTPVAPPENPVPNEKGQDRGREKDRVQSSTRFQNQIAQGQDDSQENRSQG